MSSRRSADTAIADTFPRYLADKGKGEDNSSGNYRSDADRELNRFLTWCRGETADPANASPAEDWTGIVPVDDDDTPTRRVRFSDLDATVFGDYARYLGASGFANSTQITYYSYVASWCGWAHTQGYIDRHYARESEAEDPLPTDDQRKPGDQQMWTPGQRDQLVRHVNREAEAAIDAHGEITIPVGERGDIDSEAVREKARARYAAVRACRDRALVHILSYTGLRVSEFLDDPEDDRPGRNGITWEDVSLSDQNVTVYRKKQDWQRASLPDPVVPPLRRYKQMLNPPESWRVFPTFHRPKLAAHVTTSLEEKGYNDDRIAMLREAKPDIILAADEELPSPPALKPGGARRRMKRITESADIEVNDDAEYLQPHGGRRGMGEVLVREKGYAAAARFLDNSEQQVRQAYQHVEAAERADMATEALSNTDQRVNYSPSADDS